jgi:hypothetical protein
MKEGVIPRAIFTTLQAQFGDECLSQPRVLSWPKSFREGRDRLEMNRTRRPRTSVNADNVLKTGELTRANCQITVPELSQAEGIGVGSVEETLHNELVGSKVSARWVPRLLTTGHSGRCLLVVKQLSQHYETEGAEFLDSTVTSDETWAHYFTPEPKIASNQWKHADSPPPKKSENNFFQRRRSLLLCSGIQRMSFTWTFSLAKKTSMHSIIQLS